jgi:hypothetical protein
MVEVFQKAHERCNQQQQGHNLAETPIILVLSRGVCPQILTVGSVIECGHKSDNTPDKGNEEPQRLIRLAYGFQGDK